MKKNNNFGFTLIELLAVITIMGILLLVAIPAISRTIENSRRDTYVDVVKTYINTVRNAVLADEITCTINSKATSVGATPNGIYFFKIDSTADQTKDLMESGGLSSWSNANVKGYVKWQKTSSGERTKTEYYAYLVDAGKHGLDAETKENAITRATIKTNANKGATDTLKYPSDETDNTKKGIECTLK